MTPDRTSGLAFDRPSLETRIVDALVAPSLERRSAMTAAPPDVATHAQFYAEAECLHAVELWQPGDLRESLDGATVAFWNVERLANIAGVVDLLKREMVDIALLCEVDVGMARTGQLHTIRETAARLGSGYAFGVEYIELGLGDELERAAFPGQTNVKGLHGAGVVGRGQLERPAVFRLDSTGTWFNPEFGEPRVGGRIAIAAQSRIRGQLVTFVSVHLESHTDPQDRAESTRRLLDLVDEYDPKAPVVIGGDFNTSTASRQEREDRNRWLTTLKADPRRIVRPEPYEPLFRQLAQARFDWSAANVPQAPTERPRQDDRRDRPLGKIDWFFTRDISVSGAQVVPAVMSDGSVIADHDMILLRIP